jgi:hypothetical protein
MPKMADEQNAISRSNAQDGDEADEGAAGPRATTSRLPLLAKSGLFRLRSRSVARGALGKKPTLFRPPYGEIDAYSRELVRARHGARAVEHRGVSVRHSEPRRRNRPGRRVVVCERASERGYVDDGAYERFQRSGRSSETRDVG